MKIQVFTLRAFLMLTCICFIQTLPLLAQTLSNLQLLDRHSDEPLIGVTFRYGTQQGVSDENGNVSFRLSEENLHLSHLNYGKWTLGPLEVVKALDKGKIYRAEVMQNLQPVSVISLKMAEEKDQKIMISDQERLHHDAGAVLNQNPVVASIRKSGSFGFDPVMRGFKYAQLNVVIDGLQSANAACPNRMDPPTSQVALNRIKQVEILKGPHALRYGIGLGGTINFIQEDPKFGTSSGGYGRFSTMYESNGNVFRNEGRIGLNGKNYDVGILGSWSKGTDYRDGNGNLVPASFERGTLGMYGDFRLSKKDLLQVTVNRNFARNVAFPTLGMDLITDDTWMGSVRHTRTYQGRALQQWTTSGFFTKVDHLMDNSLRDLNPRMMNARTPAITENMGGRTEGLWKFGSGKMYAGADFRTEAAQGIREREFLMGPNAGKTVLDNAWQDSRISKGGLFATYHLPVGEYVFTLAGRLDVNHAQANDNAVEFTQISPETQVTQLNPGISIGAKRDLGEHFNTGLWLARVQRSGSLTERFINSFPVGVDPWEMLGNPNLLPETNNQVDWVIGYNRGKITAELGLFAAYLNNFITGERTELTPRMHTSPGVRQFVNIDRAIKTGFEASFHQELGYGIGHQLMVAYVYGQNLERSEALPEIAPMDIRYSITGRHLDNRLHSALRIRHVMGQYRVSDYFGEQSTPRFTLLDADVSYAISSRILFKGGAQNLLNQAYYEHLNRPIGPDRIPMYAPGRNVFLMLNFKMP